MKRPKLEAGSPALVLAAWRPELAAFTAAFRKTRSRPLVVTEVVGVGLVEAALGAARAIAAHRPKVVYLVGTAGSLPGSPVDLGDVAVIDQMTLCEPNLPSVSELPAPMPTKASCHGPLARALCRQAGLPLVDAICPLAITRAPRRAHVLAETGAELETLEAFAVARAARAARVRFVAVLGVSNRVGPRGRQEWLTYGPAAVAKACEVVWGHVTRPRRVTSPGR